MLVLQDEGGLERRSVVLANQCHPCRLSLSHAGSGVVAGVVVFENFVLGNLGHYYL